VKVLRALLLLALAASAPAGAAADKPGPDRFDVASMHNFARCVVKRTRPGAEKLLAMNFKDEDYAKAMKRLVNGHEPCLGSDMKISGVLLAGSLAEALLTEDLPQAKLAGLLHPTEPALPARTVTEFTGLCMALQHPQETTELLYSDPTSKQSEALTEQYARLLPQCVRAGQQLRINKLGLRAIAALAAYRVAEANADGRS
jgi:hypothetical protein